ncbi:MAG TPA: formyltransferase family protein [Anaerolineales bacterium]|nr:formyltransferase family protein [Anaerolineales bacterium]
MAPRQYSLLFLGKADDQDCLRALEFCQRNFSPITHCLGRWGDPLPEEARAWEGDCIISYLSRWVLPAELLTRARRAAINFHPASPDYPGIGCTNFALYEDARQYGVTCHHMAPQVDTGPIIAVRRFPILPEDTVASLLARTYEHQMALFLEIAAIMAAGKALPAAGENWNRPPFTRKEFETLFRITPDMPPAEIARRIRAVSHAHWQPYVEIQGHRFEYVPPK